MPNLSTVKTDDMEALKFHSTRNVVNHHHCHNRFSQINLNRTPREFAPLNSCCSHIKFQRCSYHSQDVFNRIFPEVFDREPRHPNPDDHPFHLCCGGVEFWLPPLGNNILIEQEKATGFPRYFTNKAFLHGLTRSSRTFLENLTTGMPSSLSLGSSSTSESTMMSSSNQFASSGSAGSTSSREGQSAATSTKERLRCLNLMTVLAPPSVLPTGPPSLHAGGTASTSIVETNQSRETYQN
nr:hypothetical protein Iba_chr09cCG7790 [Ipomoea batatas]